MKSKKIDLKPGVGFKARLFDDSFFWGKGQFDSLPPPFCNFNKNKLDMNVTCQTIYLKQVVSEKMLTLSVIYDAISFFVTREFQKFQDIDKNR